MKFISLLILFLFFSCADQKNPAKEISVGNDSSNSKMAYEADMEVAPLSKETNVENEGKEDLNLKIIKNGSLSFEVSSLNDTKTKIDSLLDLFGSYFEKEQFVSGRMQNSYELKIRVPIKNFIKLLNAIENGAGKLLNKNISAKDVTAEYVDLEIRLKNQLAYLQQYKVILKKAKSIQEILEVKEKMRIIETEIEAKKGSLKYLNDRISFSTLNVHLIQKMEKQRKLEVTYFTKLFRAFQGGFKLFSSFILVLVEIWPFLLLLGLLYIFRGRLFRW